MNRKREIEIQSKNAFILIPDFSCPFLTDMGLNSNETDTYGFSFSFLSPLTLSC
uniref:Uncharacterized protein n=1 Tax=Rhizophora mucronata TaxID=61149 RepID=A0A2P2PAM8_RHIMU